MNNLKNLVMNFWMNWINDFGMLESVFLKIETGCVQLFVVRNK